MGEEAETILSNVCYCGRPSTPGVLHRSDGPCIVLENLMNDTPNPQTGSQGADEPVDNLPLAGDQQAAAPSWLDRLRTEANELDHKGQKLSAFIRGVVEVPAGSAFKDLPERDKYLLEMQLQAMGSYFAILNERIGRATDPVAAAEYDEKLKAQREAEASGVGSGGTDDQQNRGA